MIKRIFRGTKELQIRNVANPASTPCPLLSLIVRHDGSASCPSLLLSVHLGPRNEIEGIGYYESSFLRMILNGTLEMKFEVIGYHEAISFVSFYFRKKENGANRTNPL